MAQPLRGFTTNSPEAMATAATWITQCNDTHEDCKGATDQLAWYPSRLIHIGTAIGDLVRLVTPNKDKVSGPYMTLSHCWGVHKPLRMTQETNPHLVRGIKPHELPQTFQDAVMVTRQFGVLYPWIDSLCIQQDSPSDWATESLLMDQVYTNSYLNLSADWGSDSSTGLFHTRDPLVDSWTSFNLHPQFLALAKLPRTALFLSAEESSVSSPSRSSNHSQSSHLQVWQQHLPCRLINPQYWEAGVSNAKISTRGWVLQERYLSPRILHFLPRQLFWECRRLQLSEAYIRGLPSRLDHLPKFKRTYMSRQESDAEGAFWHETWCDIVSKYSRASLSFTTDKLVAISGIAKHFSERLQPFHDKYLAGLWQQRLRHHLLWSTASPSRLSRPEIYRAPSWSWASIDGAVFFIGGFLAENEVMDEVMLTIGHVHLTYPSEDVTGPVTGGYMEVTGYMGSATLSFAGGLTEHPSIQICRRTVDLGEEYRDKSPLKDREWGGQFFVRCDAPAYDFAQFLGGQGDPIVYFLVADVTAKTWEQAQKLSRPLSIIFLILLEPIAEDVGSYRRVGICSNWDFGNEDVMRLMDGIAQEGANVLCREYKNGRHTIRIV